MVVISQPIIDPDAQIDFYAGSSDILPALKSIYDALDESRRGKFYVPAGMLNGSTEFSAFHARLPGYNPIVVGSFRDLNVTHHLTEYRPFIYVEDKYNKESRGLLKIITLFLCHDQRTVDLRRMTSGNVLLYDTPADAAKYIVSFIKGKEPKHTEFINAQSVGLIYMAFGKKAPAHVRKSAITLSRLGTSYPVTVFSDHKAEYPQHFETVIWEGQSPYDQAIKHKRFRFRAGRVKPLVCKAAPYDINLYVDADTHFIQPIESSFFDLDQYDICLTEENLTIGQLYNKKFAGWEINIIERDTTIQELGTADLPFINSGVMFFRSNRRTAKLFSDWHTEWMRFQEWDEQLALMRAIRKQPELKVKYLSPIWNDPALHDDTIIWHNYGRGVVRSEGSEVEHALA